VYILGEEKQVIGKYVSHIKVDGDSIEFEDLTGTRHSIKAKIVEIDLVDNVISVNPACNNRRSFLDSFSLKSNGE
jgi:predicted RNA-binding protein